ncbi:MAG: hypothetical protein MK207_04185 [Saprospiraceae bacterium]|nr:hypothetical protein [Saprospiraceae bacterium]
MKNVIPIICIIFLSAIENNYAQGVLISPSDANIVNPNAMLELKSNNKGLLISRMSESEKLAIFPTPTASGEGLLVYQTDGVSGFYYYNGNNWQGMRENDNSGNTVGDMQYWDGNKWHTLPSGPDNSYLVMCGGVPTWLPAGSNCQ